MENGINLNKKLLLGHRWEGKGKDSSLKNGKWPNPGLFHPLHLIGWESGTGFWTNDRVK